jgi:heat shock protein HtpX
MFPMTAIGLKTQIWNNNLRSLLLIGSYPFLLAGLVWIVAALCGTLLMPLPLTADGGVAWSHGQSYATAFVAAHWPAILAAAGGWFILAYFFQGRMVRALSHARPVTRTDEPELYNLLENLCISQGMKMPRLEIIESDALNAFASGIDERSYAVTVTRGLMKTLARDELEGVLAHELTHIANRDVRLLIVSVIFTGMVGFFAQLVWSNIRFGLYSRGRDRDGRVLLVLLAIAAVLWIGYMATLLTRFALSRRREYMADAGAVAMTRRPDAMMRALQRIAGHDRIPAVPDDIAMMCIENARPFMGMFATHPPIADRIRALSAATGTPVPDPAPGFEYTPAPPDAPRKGRNPWRRRF